MTSAMDKARIAVAEVIQGSGLPVGYSVDSEKIVRAVLGALREPTDEMVDACGNGECRKWARGAWDLMMDAALRS